MNSMHFIVYADVERGPTMVMVMWCLVLVVLAVPIEKLDMRVFIITLSLSDSFLHTVSYNLLQL